jgi:hypothetical protein
MVGEKRIDDAARLASIRARVFVFVRSSRSRLHGHDHEDSALASEVFLSSLQTQFFSTVLAARKCITFIDDARRGLRPAHRARRFGQRFEPAPVRYISPNTLRQHFAV